VRAAASRYRPRGDGRLVRAGLELAPLPANDAPHCSEQSSRWAEHSSCWPAPRWTGSWAARGPWAARSCPWPRPGSPRSRCRCTPPRGSRAAALLRGGMLFANQVITPVVAAEAGAPTGVGVALARSW